MNNLHKNYHEPEAIPIGDFVKLLDERIPRIVTDEHVIICYNGHITYTSRERMEDDNNRMMKQIAEMDRIINTPKLLEQEVNKIIENPSSLLSAFEKYMS